MRIVSLQAENVKRLRADAPAKVCPGCGLEKAHSDFYPDATKRLGVGTYCKSCSIKKAAAKYQERKSAPKVTPPLKRCGTCQVALPASAFWRSPASLDGLMPECKDCRRARVRLSRYGISQEEYVRLLDAQQGACASCARADEQLVVGHDHETNEVRGLLCSACNTAIGLMGDDPERLVAAAAYLVRQEGLS